MSNLSVKIIVMVLLFISAQGLCQTTLDEEVSLVPVSGDLEIVNMNLPNQEIIYSNPEGLTKLEIYYKGMTLYISAGDEIRFASGTGILSATGGVKFTDGESTAEGGWVWYNIYSKHGEFHGNPKFQQPVDETHWNYIECESLVLDVGEDGLDKMKFYRTKNSRLYLKKEDLDKIKEKMLPEKSVSGDTSEKDLNKQISIKKEESPSVEGEKPDKILNRKVSD